MHRQYKKKLVHLLTCPRAPSSTQATASERRKAKHELRVCPVFIRPPSVSRLGQPAAILTGAKLQCAACREPTLCSPLLSCPRVRARTTARAQAPAVRTFSNRARILRRLRPTDGAPLVALQLNPQMQHTDPLPLLPPLLSIISLSSSAPVFLC